MGKIPFLLALPRFLKGSWGWWHLRWLTHVEAASHLPLSLDEGAVLGMGPRLVSVTPTEAELPRAQVAALGPCPAGALSSVPCTSPGSAPQIPSIPFQPRERCPLPTLSHCLGISPETLFSFCCPYLHLFGLIYTLTSSPLSLGASPSLCQLCSRHLLDLS